MTLQEKLKEFGARNSQIRENLLNEKLQRKYAAEYLTENKDSFFQESKVIADKLLEEYPEVRDYFSNHGPLCDADCGPCKEAGAR